MDSEKLTLLGAGAALGGVLSYCLFAARDGSVRLPLVETAQGPCPRAPKYFSGVCKVKDGMLDQYTSLHDHTWDAVMAKMHEVQTRHLPPSRFPLLLASAATVFTSRCARSL